MTWGERKSVSVWMLTGMCTEIEIKDERCSSQPKSCLGIQWGIQAHISVRNQSSLLLEDPKNVSVERPWWWNHEPQPGRLNIIREVIILMPSNACSQQKLGLNRVIMQIQHNEHCHGNRIPTPTDTLLKERSLQEWLAGTENEVNQGEAPKPEFTSNWMMQMSLCQGIIWQTVSCQLMKT